MDQDELCNRFKYHAPNQLKVELHQGVREGCETLAEYLNNLLVDGREKSVAITKLEEVMFWANAFIARNDRY